MFSYCSVCCIFVFLFLIIFCWCCVELGVVFNLKWVFFYECWVFCGFVLLFLMSFLEFIRVWCWFYWLCRLVKVWNCYLWFWVGIVKWICCYCFIFFCFGREFELVDGMGKCFVFVDLVWWNVWCLLVSWYEEFGFDLYEISYGIRRCWLMEIDYVLVELLYWVFVFFVLLIMVVSFFVFGWFVYRRVDMFWCLEGEYCVWWWLFYRLLFVVFLFWSF